MSPTNLNLSSVAPHVDIDVPLGKYLSAYVLKRRQTIMKPLLLSRADMEDHLLIVSFQHRLESTLFFARQNN